MLKPSADLIIDPKQSRYSLVVGVAKRSHSEKNSKLVINPM